MTKIWIGAQLSPAIALWINDTFDHLQARSVRGVGMPDAEDEVILWRRALRALS